MGLFRHFRSYLFIVAPLALAGCAHAPEINVLGAYFPGWLFCILGAIGLTLLLRRGVSQTAWASRLGPPVVVFPCLSLLFALLLWLLFFTR